MHTLLNKSTEGKPARTSEQVVPLRVWAAHSVAPHSGGCQTSLYQLSWPIVGAANCYI